MEGKDEWNLVGTNLSSHLRNSIQGKKVLNHWITKRQSFSKKAAELIGWKAIGKAMRVRIPRHRQ